MGLVFEGAYFRGGAYFREVLLRFEMVGLIFFFFGGGGDFWRNLFTEF